MMTLYKHVCLVSEHTISITFMVLPLVVVLYITISKISLLYPHPDFVPNCHGKYLLHYSIIRQLLIYQYKYTLSFGFELEGLQK